MQVLALIAVLGSLDPASVANPRVNNQWVSDTADLIDEAKEQSINAFAQKLYDEVGIEFTVVTVVKVGGPTRPFALALFNHWGVGSKKSNNGFMFFLSKEERALESITGTGMEEVLTDSWLKSMQDRVMVPSLKRGKFGIAVTGGMLEIARYLRTQASGESAKPSPLVGGTTSESKPSPTPGESKPGPSPGESKPGPSNARSSKRGTVPPSHTPAKDDTPWIPLGAGGAGLLGLFGFLGYRRRKKIRTCEKCQGSLILLDEVADDAYLSEGQRTEERIDSVNYEVRYCSSCQVGTIRKRLRWFSSIKKCSQCRFLTRVVTTTTEQAASYASSGRARIDHNCANCGNHSTSYRTIPMLVEHDYSSSDSGYSGGSSFGGGGSSSGGSFGGGSSSGGGASSNR